MSQNFPSAEEIVIGDLDGSITSLFEIEDIDSPILQQVAWSMWNQYMNLCEEGLIRPSHDFFELHEFIQFIKNSGVPEEIRGNNEHFIKVLGAGYATFIDEVDIDSPLLRKVSYKLRRGWRQFSFEWVKPLPNKPMPADQLVEALKEHAVPNQPDIKQRIELYGDTIFWSLDAPKIEGKYCCGYTICRLGIMKPSLKLCVLDSYLPKLWVEMLVKHPVEVDIVDNPIVREGATSCDIRIHLRPSAYIYKKDTVF